VFEAQVSLTTIKRECEHLRQYVGLLSDRGLRLIE
jgi:hypothetical protein